MVALSKKATKKEFNYKKDVSHPVLLNSEKKSLL